MITLFTGVPGAGKTAALVQLLAKIYGDRPLWVFGLEGLTLPHSKLDPQKWHEEVPDGAIIVIDEVQDVWRPMGPGQKVPDHIQKLETHRHRGIDFFLTTQSPKLVHSNVRDLTGRHVHVRDLGMLGRWWYEWPECSTALAWRTAPIKKKYKLPKAVFSLYKSASIHVKPIRSVPWVLFLIIALLVLVLGGSYYAMKRISARMNPVPAGAASAPGAITSGQAGARLPVPLTAKEMRDAARPRLPNVPNSAPQYDEIRKVVRMPRIMGGYCYSGECRCYIQGGMRAPISDTACFAWLKDPPFDPYFAPGAATTAGAERPAAYGAAASQPPT